MAERPDAPPAREFWDAGFLLLIAITVSAAVAVGLTRGWDTVTTIAARNLGFAALLLPKVLAGVFFATAIPLLLGRDRIAGAIGRESGLRGLALAALAGAAIPGGPAVTYSLGAAVLVAGADLGAVTAFVTGWSLFGLNRTLIWELSFLPYDLVGLRVLLSLPFPILCGLAVRQLFETQ